MASIIDRRNYNMLDSDLCMFASNPVNDMTLDSAEDKKSESPTNKSAHG